MTCPKCRSERCTRSKRSGIADRVFSSLGFLPWRCLDCKHRFHGYLVPASFLLYTHCKRCGNLDLQRISRELVEDWNASLFRFAHVPAYRCAPCRFRFFSMRPLQRIRAATPVLAKAPVEATANSRYASR